MCSSTILFNLQETFLPKMKQCFGVDVAQSWQLLPCRKFETEGEEQTGTKQVCGMKWRNDKKCN